LNGIIDLPDYTYYGFGGPFLEDCRLLHEYFPKLRLVSIEKERHTFKRQEFHRFSKDLVLKKLSLRKLLGRIRSAGKEVFWLDYTDTKLARFREFMDLLDVANDGTIVKVTLRAQRDDNPHGMAFEGDDSEHEAKLAEFKTAIREEFVKVWPAHVTDKELLPGKFPNLIQRMLQVAAEKILPAGSAGSVFQPIDSVSYTDGTLMLSLTGIVWPLNDITRVKNQFSGWKFANLSWQPPHKIAVPILSVKERLFLEEFLSVDNNDAETLAKALGYDVGRGKEDTLRKLAQYADFHRYYPYFAKVTV